MQRKIKLETSVIKKGPKLKTQYLPKRWSEVTGAVSTVSDISCKNTEQGQI